MRAAIREHAYFLLSGSVRVFHRSGEAELLLKLFRAPALFGEMEVMTRQPYLEFATTLEPSALLVIPAAELIRLVDSAPGFARALSFDLASRLCIAAHNLRAVAFNEVLPRLAKLLLDYAALSGERKGEGVTLGLRLSQAILAGDLAVSRKALNGALTKLKGLKLVDKVEGRYRINDLHRLKALGTKTLPMAFRSRLPRV